jgi:hypothetical protein
LLWADRFVRRERAVQPPTHAIHAAMTIKAARLAIFFRFSRSVDPDPWSIRIETPAIDRQNRSGRVWLTEL